MKYALILESETTKSFWNCYNIANRKEELLALNCFSSEILQLPKSSYNGEVVQSGIVKKNCVTQSTSIFCIISLPDLQLSNKFKLR
jgi:hypothetical protein